MPTIEETTFAASLGIDLATFTKNASGLYFKELVVGTGTLAQDGKTVGVRYKGQLPNGTHLRREPGPQGGFSASCSARARSSRGSTRACGG